MNNVLDFLEGHKTSDDIIILGQCPSTKKVPFKNGTFSRLKRWFTEVGVEDWDFHNVIPDKINSYDIKDVDEEKLRKAVDEYQAKGQQESLSTARRDLQKYVNELRAKGYTI